LFSYIDMNRRKSVLFTGLGICENEKVGFNYGEYDEKELYLSENEVKCSFLKSTDDFLKSTDDFQQSTNDFLKSTNDFHEKNGCFIPLISDTMEPMLIYKWFPLQIVSLNEKKGVIERVDVKEMPRIFQDVRGSTHGFLFHEEEIWMIAYIVNFVDGQPRDYYHMFVKMDTELNLLGYSDPFSFEGESIEKCHGLVVEEEQVIVSYSTMDSSSKIAIYDKKYVDANIEYL